MSIRIAKGKVSRTKKGIMETLLSLLENNRFEEITITEITQGAEIARRTFYLNYTDKADVLRNYIAILYQEFTEKLVSEVSRSLYTDTLAYFDYWDKHRNFLLLLEKNYLLNLLLEVYENILAESDVFDINKRTREVLSERQKKYANATLAAALVGMLSEWVKNGMEDKSSDLANVFVNMLYHKDGE